jgi:hypothetical protein
MMVIADSVTRAKLIAKAEAQMMAKWPQYKGHFDDYILVQVNLKDVKTKMGLAFSAGEVTIAKPVPHEDGGRVLWSFKNQCNTLLREKHFKILEMI